MSLRTACAPPLCFVDLWDRCFGRSDARPFPSCHSLCLTSGRSKSIDLGQLFWLGQAFPQRLVDGCFLVFTLGFDRPNQLLQFKNTSTPASFWGLSNYSLYSCLYSDTCKVFSTNENPCSCRLGPQASNRSSASFAGSQALLFARSVEVVVVKVWPKVSYTIIDRHEALWDLDGLWNSHL